MIRVALIELNEDGTTGGSHRALAWLADNLDRSRFDPIVVFYQDNPIADALRRDGLLVETWDEIRSAEKQLRRSWLSTVVAQPTLMARRWQWLRDRRVDLVHINNSPFAGFDDWLPASWLAGIPCIAHARGVISASPGLGRRLLSPRFDRVIAISRVVADSWIRFGIDPARVCLLPDGIDLEEFRNRDRRSADAVRKELGVADGDFLVLLPGTMHQWKGHRVAIDAIALLPELIRSRTTLALAGGVPVDGGAQYLEVLAASAAEHGVTRNVRILGPRRDVQDLMMAADIVLHASTKPEPFGLVVLEGMALGRAVVASDAGGPSEILDADSGVLVPPGNPAELALVLTGLLMDPPRRESLGRGALKRVEDFRMEALVQGVESIYDQLLPRGALR